MNKSCGSCIYCIQGKNMWLCDHYVDKMGKIVVCDPSFDDICSNYVEGDEVNSSARWDSK